MRTEQEICKAAEACRYIESEMPGRERLYYDFKEYLSENDSLYTKIKMTLTSYKKEVYLNNFQKEKDDEIIFYENDANIAFSLAKQMISGLPVFPFEIKIELILIDDSNKKERTIKIVYESGFVMFYLDWDKVRQVSNKLYNTYRRNVYKIDKNF